uniref:Sushi domain-containing protein n=1 Tax=Malurus cyaneus samueli TaxID=2593467 RepID=A0A8C5U0K0_9PASS
GMNMSALGRLRSGSAALGALLSAALIVTAHGDCGAPPRLASAEPRQLQEGTEGFPPGSVVHYVCRPGFGRNPRTRDSFICADGRWSGPSDMCKRECPAGYRLIGHSELKCVLRNGRFLAPPPDIENGQRTGMDKEGFVFGDSVTYRCHSAERGHRPFSLVGEASIFCTTPECKGELRAALTAAPPALLFPGASSLEASTCRDNNHWEPPCRCQRTCSCDDPPDVRNAVKARLAGNLFPVGTVVTYECRQGHRFGSGDTAHNIRCLPEFVWSEPPAPCERIVCPDPDIPNGKVLYQWHVEDVFAYGDTLKVMCNEGFAFKEHSGSRVTLHCTEDGSWNPAVPECIPEPHCPKPEVPHAKEVSKNKKDYTVGAEVRLLCEQGYGQRGSALVTCGDDLSWHPSLPFCDQGAFCGPPPAILYGYHSGRGAVPDRDESIYCTSDDGKSLAWSGPAPQCRGDLAGLLPIPHPHPASIHYHTFPYGLLLSFSCERGFILHGATQSRCQADGTWDPPVPSCQPGECHPIPAPTACFPLHPFPFSDFFPCSSVNAGPLASPSYSTCSADGTWTPPLTCKKLTCERILRNKAAFQCGIPPSELKTLLEIQKLYLEIQKLEKELKVTSYS